MIKPLDAEIMAPAGSYASLTSAINAGADSIYFGVTQLNMRAKAAANFTLDDLARIAQQCHASNIKAYLAVNTLLYDHDTMVMRRIIDAAKTHGIDAIIAFDFACVQYCNTIGMPVHLSVQFSISNYDSVQFFAHVTNRIVLARELTVDHIKAIYDKIKENQLMGNEGRLMEIEAFVHGALCVAQSGRCYMSLYTDNSSANRGACRQNCRGKYMITDMDTGKELVVDNHYIMSAADICTIDFLDELLEAGVMVMKIEGRGRSPEYVHTVVTAYKTALQDIAHGTYTTEKKKMYFAQLEKVFHRKLSKGNYYLGKELGEYSDVYGSKATMEKTFIGRVTHYYVRAGIAEAIISAGVDVNASDEIYVIGASTGTLTGTLHGLRVDGTPADTATKGDVITFAVSDRVRKNDKIYIVRPRKV